MCLFRISIPPCIQKAQGSVHDSSSFYLYNKPVSKATGPSCWWNACLAGIDSCKAIVKQPAVYAAAGRPKPSHVCQQTTGGGKPMQGVGGGGEVVEWGGGGWTKVERSAGSMATVHAKSLLPSRP